VRRRGAAEMLFPIEKFNFSLQNLAKRAKIPTFVPKSAFEARLFL
jgi:hypothetical protein